MTSARFRAQPVCFGEPDGQAPALAPGDVIGGPMSQLRTRLGPVKPGRGAGEKIGLFRCGGAARRAATQLKGSRVRS
jgi:hypothetical protein